MASSIQKQYKQYVEDFYKSGQKGRAKSFEEWRRTANVLDDVNVTADRPKPNYRFYQDPEIYNMNNIPEMGFNNTGFGRAVAPRKGENDTSTTSGKEPRTGGTLKGGRGTSATWGGESPSSENETSANTETTSTTTNTQNTPNTQNTTTKQTRPQDIWTSRSHNNFLNGLSDDEKIQLKSTLGLDDSNSNFGKEEIKALQRSLGVKDDGVIGKETSKALQNRLIDMGYDVGKAGADGKLGDDTISALKTWLNDKNGPHPGNPTAMSTEQLTPISTPQDSDLVQQQTEEPESDYPLENEDVQYTDVNGESDFDEEAPLPSNRELRAQRRSANRDARQRYRNGEISRNERNDIISRNREDYRNARALGRMGEDAQYLEDQLNAGLRSGQISQEEYDDQISQIRSRYQQDRAAAGYPGLQANVRAYGGKIITRKMMTKKFGNPISEDDNNEYYL